MNHFCKGDASMWTDMGVDRYVNFVDFHDIVQPEDSKQATFAP